MASKQSEKNEKNKKIDLDKSINIRGVSNIFETTYEKVLTIINEVKDFIKNASNSSQKLIDDLDWVIKVIANKSLYSYEVNQDKLSLRNSKYAEFINFVTKYNEEVLEMNKKHVLLSSLFGIKAQILLKPSLILKKILPDELKKMNYQEEKEKKERKKSSINAIGNVLLNLYYKGLERQKKEKEEKEKKEKEEKAKKEKEEKEKKEKEKAANKENYDKSKNEKTVKSYESDKRLISKGHDNKNVSVNERKMEKRFKKMFTAKHNIKKVDISDTEKLNSVDIKNRIRMKNTEPSVHSQNKDNVTKLTRNTKLTLTNFKKAMANYYITKVSLFESHIDKKNLSSSKLGNKTYKSNDENKDDVIHIHKIERNKNKNKNKISLKKTKTMANNSDSAKISKTENNQKSEISKNIEENKNQESKKGKEPNKKVEANKKIEANKNIETNKNIEVIKNIEEKKSIEENNNIVEKKEIIPLDSLIEKYYNELKNIIDKDFNIFTFKKLVGHRNVLPLIGHTLLKTLGLLDSRIISQKKLDSFLYTVSDSYKETTLYHNSLHGSDVAQSLCIYFISTNAEEVLETTVLDLLGMIVSAMGHDLGHPGFNNNFHINASTDLAITYNDASCLENFHTSFLFKILRKEENNILEKFSTQNYKTIRKRMISQILATDMAHHAEVVSLIRSKINASEDEGEKNFQLLSGNEKTKFEEQQILLNYMIHAADLGHNTKKFEISLEWVSLLSEEFWQQGDVEKSKGIPISFLCDRDKIDVPGSQVGFLKGFIITTFDCLVSMFPNLKYTMENAKNNIREWQKLLDQHRVRGWTPKKEIKNEKNNGKKIKNK